MVETKKETETEDEVVEIDEDGNIYSHDKKLLQASGRKPTILRDPEGEY